MSGAAQTVSRDVPLARRVREAGPPQLGQVSRDSRLRETEHIHDVSHAELAGGEDVEDAQSGRVGKPSKEGVQVGHDRGR